MRRLQRVSAFRIYAFHVPISCVDLPVIVGHALTRGTGHNYVNSLNCSRDNAVRRLLSTPQSSYHNMRCLLAHDTSESNTRSNAHIHMHLSHPAIAYVTRNLGRHTRMSAETHHGRNHEALQQLVSLALTFAKLNIISLF